MTKVKFEIEATYRYKGELEIDKDDADKFESEPTSFVDFYSINEFC